MIWTLIVQAAASALLIKAMTSPLERVADESALPIKMTAPLGMVAEGSGLPVMAAGALARAIKMTVLFLGIGIEELAPPAMMDAA